MIKKISLVLGMMILVLQGIAQDKLLIKGMVIKTSMRIKKTNYSISGFDSLGHGVIEIEGNNIVIDFNNAELKGNNQQTPDMFKGVALYIRKGKNITIKNLTAKGFKVALMARNIEGLKIENCDFSYNYRQHLNSTQEKEDISDWMSYHHNENDQWLRYGAAMYLRGCNKAVIKNCKVTGSQNALMMMECNNGLIYNNDFSFNSGIGIGLYRSSGNRIQHNRINFNVRGYSHGIYNRGQDSAGILVYEQSNGNLFYMNSVTHGGDGFFLWAGQSTMDTGEGGCNNNQLIKNDFSYAPTNGVEVTFSSNSIVNNRIFECDHGIWGGYSFNTAIVGNQFRNNRIGVAIEHGQKNEISYNIFYNDKEAIKLWSRKTQPKDWGYAKYRDTRSYDYLITGNSFNNIPLVYNLSGTDNLKIFSNLYSSIEKLFSIDSTVGKIDSFERDYLDTSAVDYVLKDAMDPFRGNGKLAGRKNIMMTEWGPYDFKYPLIWHSNAADTSLMMNFNILGPNGKWKLISAKGLEKMTKMNGGFPVEFSALKHSHGPTDIELILEFTGPSFIDQYGNRIPANKPFRFKYKKFFQPIDFNVSWYSFDSTTNPIKTNYLERLKTQRPVKSESVNKLDYAWWGGIKVGEEMFRQFLTVAEGNAEMPAGDYELGITWDDAVRVYVDGKLVVDEWNPAKYLFDESPNKKVKFKLTTGIHVFRVEHVELGGFATLSLKIKKI